MIRELQNECCVSRHENNIDFVHLHQRSWMTRCLVNEWSDFESNPFSEQ